jgi:hypothetical protein
METCIQQWIDAGDPRAVFLRCYLMMTRNMIASLDTPEFHDPAWVGALLDHFAEYYFIALAAYEEQSVTTPPVWEVTHDATRAVQTNVLQRLVLGVNAHINYDLVLASVDMLAAEWEQLSPAQRQQRYADYSHVNDVIAHTLDAAQNELLNRAAPVLEVADVVMGGVDEWLVSHLLVHWRERVWREVQQMLALADTAEREAFRRQLETDTLAKANAIMLIDGPWGLAKLL